jgi:hypothetical protein
MSGVRVLVGTKKGAFILTADGKRKTWQVEGPHFAGWEMYHLKGSPADPNRIYASQTSGWFGQVVERSDDGGKTWEAVGNQFLTRASRDAPVVRRLAAPVGVQARLAPRAVARRPGHGVRGRRGRRDLQVRRRRKELAGAAGTARARVGSQWSPAPAVWASTRSSWTREPESDVHRDLGRRRVPHRRRGTTWRPVNRGLNSQFIPNPTAEVGHCVHRIAMHPSSPTRSTCRSTGT